MFKRILFSLLFASSFIMAMQAQIKRIGFDRVTGRGFVYLSGTPHEVVFADTSRVYPLYAGKFPVSAYKGILLSVAPSCESELYVEVSGKDEEGKSAIRSKRIGKKQTIAFSSVGRFLEVSRIALRSADRKPLAIEEYALMTADGQKEYVPLVEIDTARCKRNLGESALVLFNGKNSCGMDWRLPELNSYKRLVINWGKPIEPYYTAADGQRKDAFAVRIKGRKDGKEQTGYPSLLNNHDVKTKYNHYEKYAEAYGWELDGISLWVKVGRNLVLDIKSVELADDIRHPFDILVGGKSLGIVEADRKEYPYYLPYTWEGEVPFISVNDAQKEHCVICQARNVDGTLAERTATVILSAADGTELTYKVVFEKLPELDIYLCSGQSNMVGFAPMNAADGDLEPMAGVKLFTPAMNWDIASNPLNRYSSIRSGNGNLQLGPAFSFAKKLRAKTGRTDIGLLVDAQGGMPIVSWWEKGNFYPKILRRAREAMKWGRIKGFLWLQGEADSGTDERIAAYPEQLKTLVGNLRRDLNLPELYFVASEIGYWTKSTPNSPTFPACFNAMLRKTVSEMENAGYVSAEGLVSRGDDTDPHFSRESVIVLGERFADEILKNVYGR